MTRFEAKVLAGCKDGDAAVGLTYVDDDRLRLDLWRDSGGLDLLTVSNVGRNDAVMMTLPQLVAALRGLGLKVELRG
jgi:hypothetical protein